MNNKVAWIAGGARMGADIAQSFCDRGYSIVMTWNSSKKRAEEDTANLRRLGHEAIALRCDTSSDSSVTSAVRQVQKRFGRIDVLVNMASIYEMGKLTSPEGPRLF